jgi:AcrR family transcriptional regulator
MAKRREERRAAIVAAAREFAERDGWAAVTSRRLAEAIDYTQPVVYSHFSSMDAVADAVAIEGFAELTPAMATARAEQTTERGALEAVCRAYLSYAGEHPAVYDAMFVRSTGLVFADALTPPELIAAFGELHAVVEPFGGDSETMAELLWAALHGLTLLQRTGRVPDDGEVRIRALVDRFAAS